MSGDALALEGLVVGRGSFRAGPISLRAPPGTLVAVIGPNGGGKTSLLRTLGGLDPPRAGTVYRSPGTPAMLPAPGAVDASFAAEHMVALGRAGHARGPALGAADTHAARDALAGLGAAHLGPRAFDRLSSGERQLVLLARLEVQGAAVCLLDEPTATLDPAATARVEAAMRRLAAAGRILVVATHHIPFAARADLVLTVGDPVLAGTPAEVLTPDILSRLYGTPVAPCPACGQPAHGAIRA